MTAPFPFVGQVLHYIEAREIVTERVLQFSEDLFLGHHFLIRGAEKVKPLSYCFAVMPLTCLMESMAEVAGCLAPGCGVIGFENIQALKWVAMRETDALPLQISARVQDYSEATDTHRIGVEIFSAGEEQANARATVLFSHHYQKSLDLAFVEPKNPQPYPMRGTEIYEQRQLFHGPIFQTITGQPILADHAVMGDLSVLPKSGMFHSTRQPQLLIDPLLLDGALQLFSLWSMQRGAAAYPIGARKVEIYCSPPTIGCTVRAYIQLTHHTYKLLEGDIEIQDGAGHVWLRAHGWKEWLFHSPAHVRRFIQAPTRYCLSQDLPLPNPSREAVAKCIEKDDLGDLGLWACASHYLHVDEMNRFHNLSKSPEDQLKWMLGRIVAKDAVRRFLATAADSEMLHPASFTIANGENSEPIVKNLPESSAVPTISITHSNGRAMGVARPSWVNEVR